VFRFSLAAITCATALTIATAHAAPINSDKTVAFDRAIALAYQPEIRMASLDTFNLSDTGLLAFGLVMQDKYDAHVLMLRGLLQRLLMGLARADGGASEAMPSQLFVPILGIGNAELAQIYGLPELYQKKRGTRQSHNWQRVSQIPSYGDGKFARRGEDRDHFSRNKKRFPNIRNSRPGRKIDAEDRQVSDQYQGAKSVCLSSTRIWDEPMASNNDSSVNRLTSAFYGVIDGLGLIINCLL